MFDTQKCSKGSFWVKASQSDLIDVIFMKKNWLIFKMDQENSHIEIYQRIWLSYKGYPGAGFGALT